MKGRDEGKRPFHYSIVRCSQKLDELVKNGNCSYPVGGENDTARRSAAGCLRWQEQQHSMAQHSVRDPFVYLSVNEGNETG